MEGKEVIKSNKKRDENIFELIKNLKDAETNSQLLGYFEFVEFYGLLERSYKLKLKEINDINDKMNIIGISGYGITSISAYVFYKRNFLRIAQYLIILGFLPTFYIQYQMKEEINFELLQMKDQYIVKVDKFLKEQKDPLILNSEFLTEDLIDPELRSYQQLIKLNKKL